jgi:SAM-dependent methyltransferase
MSRPEIAKDAYDSFAAVYDEFTVANDYELWLGKTILPELEGLDLRKGWALDVGCGTGRAFQPLLERGWRVMGCDVSPGMLAKARGKFGDRVGLFEADARGLPRIGAEQGLPPGESFNLVLLLNDVVNYVTEEDDLGRVFAGIEANLGSRGLIVFDANTLGLFRRDFAEGAVKDRDWEWRGLSTEFGPGLVYESRLAGRGLEARIHRQRHWPAARMEAALAAAGLRCRAAFGQREEEGRILLSPAPDEERDEKVVYVASR